MVGLRQRVDEALERPPLSQIAGSQLDELLGCVKAAGAFEDLPGKWQAAIVAAERDEPAGSACGHCGHH